DRRSAPGRDAAPPPGRAWRSERHRPIALPGGHLAQILCADAISREHTPPPAPQPGDDRAASLGHGAEANPVLDAGPRPGRRADRIAGEDRVADSLTVAPVVDGPRAAPVQLVRALASLLPDEVGMQVRERDPVDRGGEQLSVRPVHWHGG